MADSIRQQIVNAVKTRLATIRLSNGYETEIGAHVFEWLTQDLQASELPCVEFIDPKCQTIQHVSNVQEHDLEVWLKITGEPGTNVAQWTRKAVADVWKMVGVDRKWSGLALTTYPKPPPDDSDALGFEQGNKIVSGADVKLIIKYRTRNFDPYNG